MRQRMPFDLLAVLIANINIDSQDLPCTTDQFEQRGIKDQRAAAGDTRLDNQIGLHTPDDFLHGDDILWELYDGPAQPGEVIRILESGNLSNPVPGRLAQWRPVAETS